MRARSPVKWVERSKTTRTDGQRPATALRRPAIQYSGGIALHLPRPNTWPLNSQWLGRFRPFSPSDPFRPGVWRVYHIPPDKLRACFDNFRMHSSARRAMAHRDLKELAALFIQCLLFQFMQLFGNRSPLSALPFFLSQQPFGHGPRAKRSRGTTRAGLVGYLFEAAHNAIAPIRQPGAYIRSGELGSVVEGAQSNVARK